MTPPVSAEEKETSRGAAAADRAASRQVRIAMAAHTKVHASKRRILEVAEVASGLAVVALVFTYFLPKIANYGQVWSVVSTLSWPWILALLAASTLFILPRRASLAGGAARAGLLQCSPDGPCR